MAVDRYTKVVLTVIAVCLVWLSFGGSSVTSVSAQSGERVLLAGWVDEKGAVRQFPAVAWGPASAEAQRKAPLGVQLTTSTAALPISDESPLRPNVNPIGR